jgi:hypothetical protein
MNTFMPESEDRLFGRPEVQLITWRTAMHVARRRATTRGVRQRVTPKALTGALAKPGRGFLVADSPVVTEPCS